MDKLEVLFEFEDSKYGNIKRCLVNDKVIYIINNKQIEDKNIIYELDVKYGFRLADEIKDIIF